MISSRTDHHHFVYLTFNADQVVEPLSFDLVVSLLFRRTVVNAVVRR